MTNLARRILLIFTVVPFLFAVILFLPHYHYLGISLVITAFIVPGTFETWKLFQGERNRTDTAYIWLVAFSIPAVFYCLKAGILSEQIVGNYIGILIFLALSYQIFTRDEKSFKDINRKTSAALMIILYPGVFFAHSILFSTLKNPAFSIIFFMITIFANDITAYCTGMLWGKNSRKVIPISPNKSLVGFIGGFSGSIISAAFFYFIKPDYFNNNVANIFIIGSIMAVFTIVGDLIESAMKRSAQLKDSGDVLPGRGGILDNIDSIIFSAPAFYYIMLILQS